MSSLSPTSVQSLSPTSMQSLTVSGGGVSTSLKEYRRLSGYSDVEISNDESSIVYFEPETQYTGVIEVRHKELRGSFCLINNAKICFFPTLTTVFFFIQVLSVFLSKIYFENNFFADERENVQKKTFTKWVNSHLDRVHCRIQDLYADLRDGKMLIRLLEVLSGERLVRMNSFILLCLSRKSKFF